MKRCTLILLAGLLLAGLTFAGDSSCPEQTFTDPNSYGYGIDPNEIAVDPVSGQRLMLGVVTTEIGVPWEYEGYGCDPDGDTMTFASEAEIAVDGAVYTLSGIVGQVGLSYYDVSVTDTPADPNMTAYTRTGTVVVVGLPANQPPVLCGGRPE